MNSMQDENMKYNEAEEESSIDFMEIAAKLLANRKKLVKWSIVGAVVGLVVAFSIPREYSAGVTLAPEVLGGKSASGGLSALASMAGLGGGAQPGMDAVYPQLYPDVVSSVPFMTSLFNVEVKTSGEDSKTMTLQQFMEEESSSPWWSVILGLPGKIIGLFTSDDESGEGHVLNNFQLTKDETLLVEALNKRITASTDQKTMVVSIGVKMQDPLVAALVADTVTARLKDFITDYRTNKARNDLEYAQRLNEEAKKNYFEAQQKLADYLDRNQGLALYSAQTMRDRLQNEATLAFSLYNQTSQQVQNALAKVQENTPVYAVVSPATVPVKPAGPRKLFILIGFTFLGFAACAAWMLFLQPMLADFKAKQKAAAKEQN